MPNNPSPNGDHGIYLRRYQFVLVVTKSKKEKIDLHNFIRFEKFAKFDSNFFEKGTCSVSCSQSETDTSDSHSQHPNRSQ